MAFAVINKSLQTAARCALNKLIERLLNSIKNHAVKFATFKQVQWLID